MIAQQSLTKSRVDFAFSVSFGAARHANRFLYTGREFLQEVGLYDYRNRVYSPELGRFLQTDPIRFDAGDVNLYRYVGSRVTRYVDPLGLCTITVMAGHGHNFPKPGSGDSNHKVCYVGCGADAANRAENESGGGVGEYPTNPTWPNAHPAVDNPPNVLPKILMKAQTKKMLKAARKEAKKMCKPPTCCESVAIKVVCLDNDAKKYCGSLCV